MFMQEFRELSPEKGVSLTNLLSIFMSTTPTFGASAHNHLVAA
jgi:hypothetical protein